MNLFHQLNRSLEKFLGLKIARSSHLERLPMLESVYQQIPESLFFEWAVANEISLGYRPFFIQIGANDGKRFDPLLSVRERFKLPGVFFEPHPRAFEQLKHNFESSSRISFENCALVVGEVGSRPLYAFDSDDLNYLCLCSFDRNHLVELKARFAIDCAIIEYKVQQKPLRWAVEKYKSSGDLIVVCDIEGYDCELLLDFPFEASRPRLFLYEHCFSPLHTRRELEARLSDNGYRLFQSNKDTLAYRIDSPHSDPSSATMNTPLGRG